MGNRTWVSRLTLCLLVSSIFTGCAVQKQLIPTGGSRADGTVQMSYEYAMFEMPTIDEHQGRNAAAARCATWGYSDAAPFGGAIQTCNRWDNTGCIGWLVNLQYQCVGAPSASPSSV